MYTGMGSYRVWKTLSQKNLLTLHCSLRNRQVITLAAATYSKSSRPSGCTTWRPEVPMLITVHDEHTIAHRHANASGFAFSRVTTANLGEVPRKTKYEFMFITNNPKCHEYTITKHILIKNTMKLTTSMAPLPTCILNQSQTMHAYIWLYQLIYNSYNWIAAI